MTQHPLCAFCVHESLTSLGHLPHFSALSAMSSGGGGGGDRQVSVSVVVFLLQQLLLSHP